jgi:hypothetical protein
MGDVVEVIQADRDAAAGIASETHWFTPRDRFGMVQGHNDSHPIIQAFARHRLAAQTPPDSGAVGELAERLRPPASFGPTCPFCGHDPYEYVDNGLGMEKVAVSCCDLGIALFQYHDEQAVRVVGLMSEAADALTSLQAENFRLAAGQCVVENGLIGDEHGHFGCSLQARVEQLSTALTEIVEATKYVSNPYAEDACRIARTALSPTTGEGNGPTGGEPG